MKRYRFLSLLLGLNIFQSVSADSVLEYLVAEPGGKSVKRQPVTIKDGRILIRGAGGDETLDFIYSARPEELSIIDHRKHSVMTLDEKQVNRIVKQTETVQPLLKGLGEQIGKLNPGQRAKWEDIPKRDGVCTPSQRLEHGRSPNIAPESKHCGRGFKPRLALISTGFVT